MSHVTTTTGAGHRAPRLRPSSLRHRIARHWAPPRVMAIDIASAIAVIGMIGAHVADAPAVDVADPSTWTGLVRGRSSILFAVVAGISLAFVTARARDASPDELRIIRLRLVGRGAAVFVIGVALESVGVPVVVILTVYGLLFVAVIPFITWSRRRLLIAAGVAAFACPPVLAVLSPVAESGGLGSALALFGTYPVPEWLTLMFVGMAVGRSRLDRWQTAATLVVVGAVLTGAGYGVGAVAGPEAPSSGASGTATSSTSDGSLDGWSEPVPGESLDFTGSLCTRGGGWTTCGPEDEFSEMTAGPVAWGDLDPAALATAARDGLVSASPHSGGTAEIVGSGGVALIVVGLCLLVTRPLRWLLWPMAALGSCTVTAYSLHALVILVNDELGSGGWASLPRGGTYWALLAGGLLVAASIWSVAFGRGPLERLVGRVADRTAVPRPVPRDGTVRDESTRTS